MRLFNAEIAILGSGFGGSLLAAIARRLGRTVLIIERGRHPRFAIGESSTPLANLLLENLAREYDLPRLLPLSKWGAWQKAYPSMACGLKRGFTFYHHQFGRRFQPEPERHNELMVAASPHDRIADTHWYRQEFDHFLVREAQALGADYLDASDVREMIEEERGIRLCVVRGQETFSVKARFVIDASGPRGAIHRLLGFTDISSFPRTAGIFSHFTGVKRLETFSEFHRPATPPYPPDDAALHHVFEGGWIWVLRFNNGITSAGASMTEAVAERLGCAKDAALAWTRLLELLPTVRGQFTEAKPIRPFIHAHPLAFHTSTVVGRNWAMLPSAAGFVDPLLSTGFPLTLLGIERLARIIAELEDAARVGSLLASYDATTHLELAVTEELVAALYASMGNFEAFSALSLLYFAAASYAETCLRLEKPRSGFLLSQRPEFLEGMRSCCALARAEECSKIRERVTEVIEQFDIAGLSIGDRQNWHPALASDLLASAPKLGVAEEAIEALLEKCGFSDPTNEGKICLKD